MDNVNDLIKRGIELIDRLSFLKGLPYWALALYVVGVGIVGTVLHGILAKGFSDKTPKAVSGLWGGIWGAVSIAAGLPALRELVRLVASWRDYHTLPVLVLSLVGEKTWNALGMATWFMMGVSLLGAAAAFAIGALLSSLLARIWLLGKKVRAFAWSGPTMGALGGIGFGALFGLCSLIGKDGFFAWVKAFDGSLPTVWQYWIPYAGFALYLLWTLALLVFGVLESGAWGCARAAVSLAVGAVFFAFTLAAAPLAGVIVAALMLISLLGAKARKKPDAQPPQTGGAST